MNLNPVYLRLLEIAKDQGQDGDVAGTYLQTLIDVSSGRISQLKEGGKVGVKGLSRLSRLGYNPAWVNCESAEKYLLSGYNFAVGSKGVESPGDNNVQEPLRRLGRVPVISFLQAGAFAEVIDNFSPGDADEWAETTKPVNRHTFALRVAGDSMEPDFPAGTTLIIEPDMMPQPRDFVIAKNGDEATFKQLVKDGDDWYLKPMNDRYPIKPLGTARIIGVVREAIRSFR